MERGNGRRVDGARVVVDYERGRTKTDWIPRRLGGGKGGDKRRDRETERIIRDLQKYDARLRNKSPTPPPQADKQRNNTGAANGNGEHAENSNTTKGKPANDDKGKS